MRAHGQAFRRRLRLRSGRRVCWRISTASSIRAPLHRRAPTACSISGPSRAISAITAWPSAAWSTFRNRAPRPAAAASTSPSTAARRTARPSATTSSLDTGFARWADTNKFIMLFPQTATCRTQSAGVLGLVGLYGPRLFDQERAADHRRAPDAAAARRSRARRRCISASWWTS